MSNQTETVEAEYEETVYNDTQTLAVAENQMLDVVPQFSITLDEARARTKQLREFCRGQMIEGEDYGKIPGCGNKPTLLKPGAEKLNMIFGLAVSVETVSKIVDLRPTYTLTDDGQRIEAAGYVEYEIKVILTHKATGRVEAEGVGSCNSQERKYKSQAAADVANTVLKMAKKRALVDATLSATRASGIFTQDIEDMPRESFGNRQSAPQRPALQSRQQQPRTPNYSAPQYNQAPAQSGSGDLATEAQQRAIVAIAARVFGRANKDEELQKLVGKPLEQVSKSGASALIKELQERLG